MRLYVREQRNEKYDGGRRKWLTPPSLYLESRECATCELTIHVVGEPSQLTSSGGQLCCFSCLFLHCPCSLSVLFGFLITFSSALLFRVKPTCQRARCAEWAPSQVPRAPKPERRTEGCALTAMLVVLLTCNPNPSTPTRKNNI